MRDYVISLRTRFGDAARLARFMGVSLDTVKSWTSGRNRPTGPALVLLQVLSALAEGAPLVFDALVPTKPAKRPKHAPAVVSPLKPIAPAPKWAPLTPHQLAERDARNAAELGPDWNKPVNPETLLGRTRVEWLVVWESDDDTALLALSDDDYERVRELIGK